MSGCTVSGCDRPHHAKAMCKHHYQQQWWKRRRPRHVIDVDPVVVGRVLAGEPCECNRAERRDVLPRLRQAGRSYSQIARLVGVTPRTVHRELSALGLVDRRCAS